MMQNERSEDLYSEVRERTLEMSDKFPIALADNFWVLGNYYFNLYLVKGKNASALIEAGVSAVVDSVIMQLDSLNISPQYIVVTHPHADHVTGLGGLREKFPEAMLVAGKGAKEFLTHPKALPVLMKEDRFMSGMLSHIGNRPGRSPVTEFFFPESHVAVKDEYEIDLGDIVLRCIKVGGHSPGNIVVHISNIDALILSDSLGFHYPGRGFLPLFLCNFIEYLHTIEHMKSLKPKILGLGHQGPIIGSHVESAFRDARQAALKMLSRVMEERKDNDIISNEIFRECYRDEFTIYSEENIRNVAQLLVRRSRETISLGLNPSP